MPSGVLAAEDDALHAGGDPAETIHQGDRAVELDELGVFQLLAEGEITGLDLGDAEVSFNLRLATRAWQTLAAQAERPDRDSDT